MKKKLSSFNVHVPDISFITMQTASLSNTNFHIMLPWQQVLDDFYMHASSTSHHFFTF